MWLPSSRAVPSRMATTKPGRRIEAHSRAIKRRLTQKMLRIRMHQTMIRRVPLTVAVPAPRDRARIGPEARAAQARITAKVRTRPVRVLPIPVPLAKGPAREPVGPALLTGVAAVHPVTKAAAAHPAIQQAQVVSRERLHPSGKVPLGEIASSRGILNCNLKIAGRQIPAGKSANIFRDQPSFRYNLGFRWKS